MTLQFYNSLKRTIAYPFIMFLKNFRSKCPRSSSSSYDPLSLRQSHLIRISDDCLIASTRREKVLLSHGLGGGRLHPAPRAWLQHRRPCPSGAATPPHAAPKRLPRVPARHLIDDHCKAAACFLGCPRVALSFPYWAEAVLSSASADEGLL